MADSVTMTSENASEFLEAAAAAVAEADGTTPVAPAPPAADEAPVAAEGGEAEAEETPAKVQGLEIQDAEAEADTEPEAKAEGEDAPADDSEGIDMQAVFEEYTANGSIAQETNDRLVAALESAGFGAQAQGLIDQHLAGASASVAVVRDQAFGITGGEEQYATMMGWAQENLPASEIEAFNQAVANPAMVPLAVRGLHAQYQAATGTSAPQADAPPARVAAGANVQSGLAPVRSLQQIAEITADPRYDADPAFRAEQDARIKASMDAGLL